MLNNADLPERMSVSAYREMLASGRFSIPSSTKAGGRGREAGPGGRAKPGTPEEDLHRLCFQMVQALEAIHPILRYMHHVPNGGARSKGEAGKMKAMGTRPGVPDFMLPRARGQWKGLAVEMKSPIGKLSEDQKFWLKGLDHEGYLCSVCRSLEHFEAIVFNFLNAKGAPPCIERGWD